MSTAARHLVTAGLAGAVAPVIIVPDIELPLPLLLPPLLLLDDEEDELEDEEDELEDEEEPAADDVDEPASSSFATASTNSVDVKRTSVKTGGGPEKLFFLASVCISISFCSNS